ncbi:MAG: 3'-5' exonuclease, partial [Bacteroidales bacterium]
ADEVSLPDKIEAIKKHYYPILEATDEDAEIRKLDIEMIHDHIGNYETLEKFLSDFALNPPSKKMAKRIDPLIDETEEKPVVVSTIHSAKGLEWNTVFVVHALEGVIPSVKAATEEEIEEERRLFYVACTRAKQNLFIARPAFLSNYGAFLHEPSRFISEIPEKLYDKITNKADIDGA